MSQTRTIPKPLTEAESARSTPRIIILSTDGEI